MVALKFGLGDSGLLEVELVKDRIGCLGHEARGARCALLSRPEWYTQSDHATKAIRPHERRIPRYRRPPIMSHDDTLRHLECLKQANNIADRMKERERRNTLGTVRLPEPPPPRGVGGKPRLGECNELVPPRVPRLREPMTHNHKRAGPCLGDMHFDAVRCDSAMTDVHLSLLHRQWLRWACGACRARRVWLQPNG